MVSRSRGLALTHRAWGRFVSLALCVASCGCVERGLVGQEYAGEPRFEVSVTFKNTQSTDNPAPTVFWLGSGPVVATSAAVFEPTTSGQLGKLTGKFSLLDAPPADALFRGSEEGSGEVSIGQLVLFDDVNRNGLWDPLGGEEWLGGSDTHVIYHYRHQKKGGAPLLPDGYGLLRLPDCDGSQGVSAEPGGVMIAGMEVASEVSMEEVALVFGDTLDIDALGECTEFFEDPCAESEACFDQARCDDPSSWDPESEETRRCCRNRLASGEEAPLVCHQYICGDDNSHWDPVERECVLCNDDPAPGSGFLSPMECAASLCEQSSASECGACMLSVFTGNQPATMCDGLLCGIASGLSYTHSADQRCE